MPVAGPFYFAWVDETETTFGSEHHRMDEYVFSARRLLVEGEKPKLQLEIENPRVGLLSPSRKQWAWFAWNNGDAIVPMFFGRLLGTPTDLQGDTITVTFNAWPANYKKQLQSIAETLKVAPFYDPVFTDVAHRDDPMSLLESHSKLLVVDPVTLIVSVSDILDAEDGNVDFTADDHFYDSLSISPSTVPKSAVHVDASVSWTQTAHGYLDIVDAQKINGPLADGIAKDWPKPGSQIADGIRVFNSTSNDLNHIAGIEMVTVSGSYQNKEKHHEDGDTLSYSFSMTSPRGGGNRSKPTTMSSHTGLLDPFATDGDGDPSPTNIPASVNATFTYTFSYLIAIGLTVEYQAARQHTERVIFTLQADVQPTLLDPQVTDDSETIVISGSDVGVPIIDLLNWTTVSGEHVDVGTVIFPDDPQFPGGTSAQVATQAGTAGPVEPEFSDVFGEQTTDNDVIWSSLGVAQPTENAANWSGVAHVPAGYIILPQRPLYITWRSFTSVARAAQTTVSLTKGQSVSEGTIVQSSNGSFQVCVVGGDGSINIEPSFSGTWGTLTNDLTAVWRSLGMTLPTGSAYFIATTGGVTGGQYIIPPFGSNSDLNDTVTDGSVVWVCIGSGEIPVGGVPGNVNGNTYYGTERGHRSIEHLICRSRARLRYTSRCVASQFQCSYKRGLDLSLRKSVSLHDDRLPNGVVAGKVTSVEHVASGGEFVCNVNLASAVGLADTIEEVPGDPTYADVGYVDDGYQLYSGIIVLVPTLSDVAYSPIVPVPDEDGITFPLTRSSIVISQGMRGASATTQLSAIESAAGTQVAEQLKTVNSFITGGGLTQTDLSTVTGSVPRLDPIAAAIQANLSWYELVLKPLNGNGGFNHVYHLKCTKLQLPKMVDLVGPPNSDLSSPLVSSADSFGTPTVAGGDRILLPSIYGDGDVFRVPVVAGGDRTLAPLLYAGGDVVSAPEVAGGGAPSVSRNVFQQPFGVNSVWNTPLGLGGGGLVSAGTGPHGGARYKYNDNTGPVYEFAGVTITAGSVADESPILLGPASPTKEVKTNTVGWSGGASARCAATQTSTGVFVPVPTDAYYPGMIGSFDDPCANPGLLGSTPNSSAAILLADRESLYQNQPMQICSVGGSPTTEYFFEDYGAGNYVSVFADETSSPPSFYGSHGGSAGSALGGLIRIDELIAGNCPIVDGVADVMRHALGIQFNGHVFDAFTGSGGHVWPATTSDLGNEGLLLALLPTFDLGSLTTTPAKSIAWTLMNYGAYTVDNAFDDVMDFDWEYSYGDSSVDCPTGRATCQFKTEWGYSPETYPGDTNNTDWWADLQTIAAHIYVVTNNGSSAIGGGSGSGGRLQPDATTPVDPGVVGSSPVVTNASLSLSHTGLSAGQYVGQVTATHSPYKWALSGTGAGNFWIQPRTGLIYVSQTGVSGISAGTYTLTATATNIVGGATGTATITVT